MTQIQYKIPDSTDTAINISENGQTVNDNIVTVSTGIQFKVKSVGKHAIARITEKYTKEKPKPPFTFVQAKGRKELNTEHPDYQEAMQMWQISMAMALNNFLMLMGMDIIEESIPDNLVHYNSEEWQEEMQIIGSNPTNKRSCYLDWLTMIACPLDDTVHNGQVVARGDISNLLHAIGRKSGISGEDVEEAVQKFQR